MSAEDPEAGLERESEVSKPLPWRHGLRSILIFLEHSLTGVVIIAVVGLAAYACKNMVDRLDKGEHDAIFFILKTLEYALLAGEGILVICYTCLALVAGWNELARESSRSHVAAGDFTRRVTALAAILRNKPWHKKTASFFLVTALGAALGWALLHFPWGKDGPLPSGSSPSPELSKSWPPSTAIEPPNQKRHSPNTETVGGSSTDSTTEEQPDQTLSGVDSWTDVPTTDSLTPASSASSEPPNQNKTLVKEETIIIGGEPVYVFPKNGPSIVREATFGKLPHGFESPLADMRLSVTVAVDESGAATINSSIQFPANFPKSDKLKDMMGRMVKDFVTRSKWKPACDDDGKEVARNITLVVILAPKKNLAK